MKKTLLVFFFLNTLSHSYAQVGINSKSPNATLEIKEKRTSNLANDINVSDGIIIPRLSKSELALKNLNLYNSTTTDGILVFVSDIGGNIAGPSALTVENINAIGFYYLAADNKWSPINGIGLDNSNDAWIDNPTNTRVELATTSTGQNRAGNTQVVITDAGNLGINILNPSKRLEINAATETNSTDAIKISNLKTSPTTDTTIQIDVNGNIGKKTEVNTIGQIVKIPINKIDNINAQEIKPLILSTPLINTVTNTTITNYTYNQPYSFSTSRINLPKGIYRIELKIIGYFNTASKNNSINIKTLVNGLEYTNQDYSSNTEISSNNTNYNGFTTTDFLELIENASLDFVIKNNTNTFTLQDTADGVIASLVLIQRLK